MCHIKKGIWFSRTHLIFVKSCPTVTLCFYGQNKSKISQNMFHALLNNPINKNTHTTEEKNLRRSKIRGRQSRVGMTAFKDSMVFFKASLTRLVLNIFCLIILAKYFGLVFVIHSKSLPSILGLTLSILYKPGWGKGGGHKRSLLVSCSVSVVFIQ